MNKNTVIFILVVMVFISSIWGSIANRKNVRLEDELGNLEEKISQLTQQSAREREQVLGKTAGLQENLLQAEEQLAKARLELVALRKETQALEARLSGCNATVSEISEQNKILEQKLRDARKPREEAAGSARGGKTGEDLSPPPEELGKTPEPDLPLTKSLQENELATARLQLKYDACTAELSGLEKIIRERSDSMDTTGQEMKRLKTNLDVLLSRISDQQKELQELREENRQLLKEIAAKNDEIANLQLKIIQQPVQQ